MNPQDSYDQLRRRNRRRLVGAVVMVVAAGGILLTALNRQSAPPEAVPTVDIAGVPAASAPTTASSASAASAPVLASASAAAASVPAASIPAASLAGNNQTPQVGPATAPLPSLPKPAPNVEHKSLTAPSATAKQPAVQAHHTPQTVPVKPQTPERKADTHSAEVKKATVKPVSKPTPTTQSHDGKKTANTHSVTKNDNKKPARPATQDDQKSKVHPSLTPQQILKNQAAAEVKKAKPASSSNAKKTDPNAILNGRSATAAGSGKALIQIGAYTSEQQAKAIQQKLTAAGVSAHISQSQTSKGTLYRVRTGTYASRAQAQQKLGSIRSHGLDGIVIGQ
ncbi:SPOR domain-containing protein [Snodgrassella sp. CFCC 13594]|uniref:SPOR domain-containing protein n=1 Tax=Snodgrassella sp. CFCC 13594 TaxID=1775559 RepID=UPI000831400E|nr:SPOR domain-containing protein [Snodgrassella sp. CFCC 13594]